MTSETASASPTVHPVLIAGAWRAAQATDTFRAENPATRESLDETYPVSAWADCDAALDAAVSAAAALRELPAEKRAAFLEAYARAIEEDASALVEAAHTETGLPTAPRLSDVELPRTTNQLRQAAAAAIDGSWAMPTIDTATGIRSCFGPIGPVVVFGPNNFPFAFGSASGGDFAAAIAAGNPVIAKAHPLHPGTTRRFAEAAVRAIAETGLPPATLQLLYHVNHDDGARLVADARVGAIGYTGSRRGGLALKEAADRAGKPIYLELSSINPVVLLRGALEERGDAIAEDFATSCLMAAGQFCTSPGLIILPAGDEAESFMTDVANRLAAAPAGTLLSRGVAHDLGESVRSLIAAGAQPVVEGAEISEGGYAFGNTMLRTDAASFLAAPHALQAEAFGNASLFVTTEAPDQVTAVIEALEGQLTGTIYSATDGTDDATYDAVASPLRTRVGRLLNDKMPTGVALSPAMHHGGPFPATGHPGFTAVGMPASLHRFAMLQSYDNVRPHRLPPLLQDPNPTGETWRLIDGEWTKNAVG